jgi:hypothetical protein
MNDSDNTAVTDGDDTINNAVPDSANAPDNGEKKTFTQDDVNRIVGERLSKDRAKSEAEFAKREQELVRRELAISAKESLAAKGYAPELLEALNYSSPEALKKSLELIERQFGKKKEEPASGFRYGKIGGNGQQSQATPIDPVKRAMGIK